MEKVNKIYLKTRFENGSLIQLRDIVKLIKAGDQLFWAVLDFDALDYQGEAQPISINLRSNIYEKKTIPISWSEINILSQGVGQFIDLIIIGSQDPKKLKNYEHDDEMFKECDIVIIMFDTSWWEIGCKDSNQMDIFIKNFKNEIRHDLN